MGHFGRSIVLLLYRGDNWGIIEPRSVAGRSERGSPHLSYSVDEKLSFLGENTAISRQNYRDLYYGMEDIIGINTKGISLLYMISAGIRGLSLSVIGLT